MDQSTMTVPGQLPDILPRNKFEALTGQQKGDRRVRRLTCWQLFTVLLYAQITGKESLREIELGLLIENILNRSSEPFVSLRFTVGFSIILFEIIFSHRLICLWLEVI